MNDQFDKFLRLVFKGLVWTMRFISFTGLMIEIKRLNWIGITIYGVGLILFLWAPSTLE